MRGDNMAEEKKIIKRCNDCYAAYVDSEWIRPFTKEWIEKITFEWRTIVFNEIPSCPDCNKRYEEAGTALFAGWNPS